MIRVVRTPLVVTLVGLAVLPIAGAACQRRQGGEPSADVGSPGSDRAGTETTAPPGAEPSTPSIQPTGDSTAAASAAVPRAPLPPDAMSAAGCQKLLDDSEATFKSAIASAARTCRQADDCAFSHGDCRPHCGAFAIAKSDQARYERSVAKAIAMCDEFDKGHCAAVLPLAIPTCSPYRPACVDGRCQAERVEAR